MKATTFLLHLTATALCCLLPLSATHAQDEPDNWMTNGRPENLSVPGTLAANNGAHRIGSRQTAPLTCTGSPRVPLVLVQFADKKFQTPNDNEADIVAYYDTFCNGEDEAAGKNQYSIRDYFKQQSGGLFTPQFSVLGPVTLPKEAAYYGQNSGSSKDIHFNEFCNEAVKLVQESDVNWMDFDNDGNGSVDMVFFIFAGLGENSSHQADDIWAKEAVRNTTINGITYACYGCTSELRPLTRDQEGNITATEGDGIGVACHELSHALGLPDLYNTGSGSSVPGMDLFSLMDYGSYCQNGFRPVAYTAYERDFMGWLPLVELDSPQKVTLLPIANGGKGYKVTNPANPDEYYILENRQSVNADATLGRLAHGLLVTHVDYSSSAWSSNTLNNNAAHQRMTFISAANDPTTVGNAGSFQEWTRALAGHLYPGTSLNYNLTDESTPAATVFTGGLMHQPIRDITEHSDGTVTLSFCIDEGDGVTAPQAGGKQGTQAYDPAGRGVSPTGKGLYIINGKKLIVR